MPTQMPTPVWDAKDYEEHSATQLAWARDCVERLAWRGDERVLDLGCGDGRITAELAERLPKGSVLGADASAAMIAHARSRRLGGPATNLSFAEADAARLTFPAEFDLVVSFNCLHWVLDQGAVLAGIARCLAPGGRLFLHFGGRGNVAGMRAVVERLVEEDTWCAAFAGMAFPWCFPSAAEYRSIMEEAGLRPTRVELLKTQMSHQGSAALAGWVRTTWLPYLERLPAGRREEFVYAVVQEYLALRPADERGVIAVDAVRLEAEGLRP